MSITRETETKPDKITELARRAIRLKGGTEISLSVRERRKAKECHGR
jgi:hypothetical protein